MTGYLWAGKAETNAKNETLNVCGEEKHELSLKKDTLFFLAFLVFDLSVQECIVLPSVRRLLLISNCSMNEKDGELTVCFKEIGVKLMSVVVI